MSHPNHAGGPGSTPGRLREVNRRLGEIEARFAALGDEADALDAEERALKAERKRIRVGMTLGVVSAHGEGGGL